MRITDDLFAAVIRKFQESDKFKSLAKNTQSGWRHVLRIAENSLGPVPIDEIRPKLVQVFLDALIERPGTQYIARTALTALEKWAIVREELPRQIMLGVETQRGQDSHEPWSEEQVVHAVRHLRRKHLLRAILLASSTGQRGGDLIRMRVDQCRQVQGYPGIDVVQQKTGVRVWIPFHRDLIAAMRTWDMSSGYLVVNCDGRPYRDRVLLSQQWYIERRSNPALAGFESLHLHGLRATAVIRLRRAGASISQICDLVGMSQKMVVRYCRRSDQEVNAIAALNLLGQLDPGLPFGAWADLPGTSTGTDGEREREPVVNLRRVKG
ncbi:MAG: tyrosine-type recombinase/integrase [Acetobacteraceae bacterium]|nr:tyrosine-type recombinase/integrase [Acetobacteraceae bacterium]